MPHTHLAEMGSYCHYYNIWEHRHQSLVTLDAEYMLRQHVHMELDRIECTCHSTCLFIDVSLLCDQEH